MKQKPSQKFLVVSLSLSVVSSLWSPVASQKRIVDMRCVAPIIFVEKQARTKILRYRAP